MPFGWNLQLDNVYGHFVKAHGNKVKLKTFENNETRFNPILQEKNTCACNYHLNSGRMASTTSKTKARCMSK